MTKVLLNVKTDEKVKKEAQRLAKSMGIPLSTIVNAYLKEFITKREVTFSEEPQIRPEVGSMLLKQSKEAREGKNLSGPFETVEDMMKHLRNA